MKIAWLQDYDIFSFPGGAEMNDAAMFTEGLKRGNELKLLGPTHPFWKPDLLIVSNCVQFDKKRISDMIDAAPTAFFFHDYIFCKYRLFYPMIDHCRFCESSEFWLKLFLKAKLLIWLSPLHREATLTCFPELADKKYALIPSAINPNEFLDASFNPNRIDAYLSVNSLFPFKGRDNLITYIKEHPDKLFHIVAQPGSEVPLPGNAQILEAKTYNDMPSLFSMYKYYVELPSQPAPFNRTVLEAKLAGCKVITNKLMGAASWEWWNKNPMEIATELRKAPTQFWEAIEEVLL